MSIFDTEISLWNAIKTKNYYEYDRMVFKNVTIFTYGLCMTKAEYMEALIEFDIADFVIENFEIILETEEYIQTSYLIETASSKEENLDFVGKFFITRTWMKTTTGFLLMYSMDSRSII